ncbi:MAG: ASCH domain-containing protein [Dehalococcoidales bacterium]|jgi:predicted transcriptional regulator
MYVLLSVKPKFARDIFSGLKKYEYRKTIFTRKNINTVIVYASSPKKCVIGEFEIEEIIYDDIESLWARTKNESGISKKFFYEYFGKQSKGYAIKIKNQKEYDNPYSLNHLTVLGPPQSFMYLNA